jgi:signal transduction histidine kinase
MENKEEYDEIRNYNRDSEHLNIISSDLTKIIDYVPISIACLDTDFDFIIVNREYAEADEKEVSFFPGKNHFDLYPNKENEQIFKKVLETKEPFFITNKPFEYAEHPERGISYWDWSLIPMLNDKGDVKYLVLSLQNVTKRYKAEQNLKASRENYQKAYNRMNLYQNIIAHDINNILNNIKSIIGVYSLINKETGEESDESFNLVNSQVKRAESIINNIVHLSQLEKKQTIKLKEVQLNRCLLKVVDFIKKSIPSNKLNIQVDMPQEKITVKANELLLDIFENILNNAIKHNTNEVIEISIKVSSVSKGRKKYAKIEFIDNGIGIPDNKKKYLFKDKHKSYDLSKGMGLGLILVEKIIENYKGDIMVKNRIKDDYNKGSNFILLIPRQ